MTLLSLHPNPGWIADPVGSPSTPAESVPTAPIGKHCILELYGCCPAKLDDEAFLRSTITAAVQRAGATLLHLITHHFEPQGVTGLALLAESHLSIHTPQRRCTRDHSRWLPRIRHGCAWQNSRALRPDA